MKNRFKDKKVISLISNSYIFKLHVQKMDSTIQYKKALIPIQNRAVLILLGLMKLRELHSNKVKISCSLES